MKARILKWLYASGLFGCYHAWRNRRVLTVIGLHRVLAQTDPRWQGCDPLYTLSEPLFRQCLEFLRRHYTIVSLTQVLEASRGDHALPPRPLLITFDDGWADNHAYALPALRQACLPAALFVASDVLDRPEAFFQERMISAWRRGTLTDAALERLAGCSNGQIHLTSEHSAEARIRSVIAQLQSLPVPRRCELLSLLDLELADDQRQMLTGNELRELAAEGVEVGTHGKSHEAMTTSAQLEEELVVPRRVIAATLGVSPERVRCLSFPFSKADATVTERARQAGYSLLFGGGLSLNPFGERLPTLLARVGISAPDITDARGNLRTEALAAYLFRRPKRALQVA